MTPADVGKCLAADKPRAANVIPFAATHARRSPLTHRAPPT
jgi:hypothetical protein